MMQELLSQPLTYYYLAWLVIGIVGFWLVSKIEVTDSDKK